MHEQHLNGVSGAAGAVLGDAPGVAEGLNGRGWVLCPYCGQIQAMGEQCERCRGLFEPLSRQATQNQMGPWQVRSERHPFGPGFSYEKLKEMVAKGKVLRATVVRGPSTRQFWSLACNAPGVAVLLGECHNCHAPVQTDEYLCRTCGAVLTCSTDRQFLGLGPVKMLPGEGPAHEVASSAGGRLMERPASPAALPQVAASRPAVVGATAAVGGVSLASRRRALRRAEASRAMIAVAVVLVVIGVAVVAVMVFKGGGVVGR